MSKSEQNENAARIAESSGYRKTPVAKLNGKAG
jgi:hypothetical protein